MTKPHGSPEERRLSFAFRLPAPPEKVWRALTIPAFLDRWLPLEAPRWQGASVTTTIVEAEAPRRLSWRWREAGEPDGTVTFTLTPDADGGTLLQLVHVRGLAAAMPPAANSNSAVTMLAA